MSTVTSGNCFHFQMSCITAAPLPLPLPLPPSKYNQPLPFALWDFFFSLSFFLSFFFQLNKQTSSENIYSPWRSTCKSYHALSNWESASYGGLQGEMWRLQPLGRRKDRIKKALGIKWKWKEEIIPDVDVLSFTGQPLCSSLTSCLIKHLGLPSWSRGCD